MTKKKIIVTTTINKPTIAIEKFDNMKDWLLIVVGDKKTPKNYRLKNGIYLSPEDQIKIDKDLSNLIGWNCIERRNFGFILAHKLKADIVATVDDDNIPLSNWGKNLLVGTTIKANKYSIKDKVFDPIYVTKYKKLWHRGFPVELLESRRINKIKESQVYTHVQADFWNGDPDIDAICRLMEKPKCKFEKKIFPFYSNNLSPFNTQNTFLLGSLLKYYFLFVGVGRMHDIWASYYLQFIKKINVVYNASSVIQKRNKHDIMVDLKDEFHGIKNNFYFANSIIEKKFKLKSFYSIRSLKAYSYYKKHF